MISACKSAHYVRHKETHKADKPRKADRCTCEQGCKGEPQKSGFPHVDPDARGNVLAKRERVERAREDDGYQQCGDYCRKGGENGLICRTRKTADEEYRNVVNAVGEKNFYSVYSRSQYAPDRDSDKSYGYLARARQQITDPQILAVVAARRAKQLAAGGRPMIKCDSENLLDVALLEIAEGLLTYEFADEAAEADAAVVEELSAE